MSNEPKKQPSNPVASMGLFGFYVALQKDVNDVEARKNPTFHGWFRWAITAQTAGLNDENERHVQRERKNQRTTR